MDNETEGIELSRITIVRRLQPDGTDSVEVESARPDGEGLSLVESLGLLEFAKAHLAAPLILSEAEGE
ncbi:hypothetical protein GS502_01355 [Rhodococcus hoagii]|nr:hypothetical protein [Prescottella equi]